MLRFDPKNPLDFSPFTVDFVNLLPAGDTIVAGSVTPMPASITIGAVSFLGTQLTVWLGDGSDGTDYELSHAIDSAAGVHEVRPTAILVTSEM